MSIPHSIAVAQEKGGVGKTSCATNLAGLLAAAGRRVLLVDLDPQGNCALDLGYDPDEHGENGKSLFAAVVLVYEPYVIRDVGGRVGLDVIPGGRQVRAIHGSMQSVGANAVQDLAERIEFMVAKAGEYDVVVFDTPPGDVFLGNAVLGAVSHVITPAQHDDASVIAVDDLADRIATVREALNPSLQFVGCVPFAIGASHRRIERQIRDTLVRTLGADEVVMRTRVRDARRAAAFARRTGRLIHELPPLLAELQREKFQALRDGGGAAGGLSAPDNVDGLLSDYVELAVEVHARVNPADTDTIDALRRIVAGPALTSAVS